MNTGVENRKFPVKYPVCRELTRRQVRTALPPQPSSPAKRPIAPICRERPVLGGFSGERESLRVAKSAP